MKPNRRIKKHYISDKSLFRQDLIDRLNIICERIHRERVAGRGNWIITSPQVAEVINNLTTSIQMGDFIVDEDRYIQEITVSTMSPQQTITIDFNVMSATTSLF